MNSMLNTKSDRTLSSLPQSSHKYLGNISRSMLDSCPVPSACFGSENICSSAYSNMLSQCDDYLLGRITPNITNMRSCCESANVAYSTCSSDTFPRFCSAFPIGLTSICSNIPSTTSFSLYQPTPYTFSLQISIHTGENHQQLYTLLMNSSQGLQYRNALRLDIAASLGIQSKLVIITNILDTMLPKVMNYQVNDDPLTLPFQAAATIPASPIPSPLSTTPSSTPSNSHPSPSTTTTPSTSTSPSISSSISSSPSSSQTESLAPSFVPWRRRLSGGLTSPDVVVFVQVTTSEPSTSSSINSYISATTKEPIFNRSLSLISNSLQAPVPSATIYYPDSGPSASINLSGGIIAGIVLAIVVFLSLIIMIGMLLRRSTHKV